MTTEKNTHTIIVCVNESYSMCVCGGNETQIAFRLWCEIVAKHMQRGAVLTDLAN